MWNAACPSCFDRCWSGTARLWACAWSWVPPLTAAPVPLGLRQAQAGPTSGTTCLARCFESERCGVWACNAAFAIRGESKPGDVFGSPRGDGRRRRGVVVEPCAVPSVSTGQQRSSSPTHLIMTERGFADTNKLESSFATSRYDFSIVVFIHVLCEKFLCNQPYISETNYLMFLAKPMNLSTNLVYKNSPKP